jgi:hypothetical protein
MIWNSSQRFAKLKLWSKGRKFVVQVVHRTQGKKRLLFQAASPSLAQPTIVAVFVAAFVWYIRFAKQRAELSPAASSQTRRSLSTMLIEVAKTLVLVMILAGWSRKSALRTG